MRFIAWACLAFAAVHAPGAHAAPSYILAGYRLHGWTGGDPDALVAKLTPLPGAPINETQIVANTEALAAMLKARHVPGQLFATMAEKNGRVWVLFDLFPDKPAQPGK